MAILFTRYLGIANALRVNAVFTNKDYEPYAKQRDSRISKLLYGINIDFHLHKDHVIFEHPEIVSGKNKPYKVYTPYKNKWLNTLSSFDYSEKKSNLKNIAPLKGEKNFVIIGVFLPWVSERIRFG